MSGSRTSRDVRRALLLCTCVVLGPAALSALDPDRTLSQYIVTRWDSRSAFPGGAINAIAQTPDGYLWIGAEKGLVRFDGISFHLMDRTNSPTVPLGQVLGLAVDTAGDLWVRMQSPYLVRYRGGTSEQMYPVKLPQPFTSASQGGATAITCGTRGDALIATPGGPLRYLSGEFTPLLSSGHAGGIPISIAETADGAVWIGMRDSGLFCVRDGRGSQVGLPDQKVNVLLPGADPELWIGTDSGLLRWDGAVPTRRGVPPVLARSPILALTRDRDANLWVSTPAGITRMDARGSTVNETGGNLPGAVHAIFEDREGNLWFGGAEGLMQLRDAPFLSYAGVADDGGSLYADPSGRAWIAPSSGGLLWVRGAERHAIATLDREVFYSLTGRPGEVWVGRRLGGVTQLREQDGVFYPRTFTAADGLAPGVIYAIYRTHDGSVWAGALSGAVSRIENNDITTFTTADGLSGEAVTTIGETADGAVWVGTAGGLQSFRNGHWRRYGGEDGLPPGPVNSLAVDGDGVLWIGSSSGLFYSSGARIESPRNPPDALRGEIYGLAADDVGNLWVATESHVVSMSRASLLGQSTGPATVREFGIADGLPSTRGIRRDRSVAKDPSGRIWFSLQGGLCVVNPSLPSATAPGLVNVESIAVDGRPLPTEPIARYPSNRQRVVFNFKGVSLAVPGRVRYRYLLDGYDPDWSQPTESREAVYTNLRPARYTFRVMASNSEGLWNGTPASVLLEVEPQLSETWEFRVTVLCLIAGAVFAGFRYRMARAHAAMNLRFEERLAERARIARELHDTLLQSFQGLMLRLQVVDDLLPPGKAKEQLQKSLERGDQAIAEGRDAVHDLRSPATDACDLAQSLKDVGEEMVTQDSAAFRVVVEGPTRELHPIIRDEVYYIIREALRNAFSHAAAHHIETEITYGDRALRLRIRDDGQGVPSDLLKGGRPGHYGLSGMRERAERIGGKLEIWSGPKAGTEIELSIAASTAYCDAARPLGFRAFGRKRGGR